MLITGTAEIFTNDWMKNYDNKYLAEPLFNYLCDLEDAP